MSEDLNEIAAAIRELRRSAKLTQTRFASQLRLSPATIYRYEAGARPDLSSLEALFRFAERSGEVAIANAFRKALHQRGAFFVDELTTKTPRPSDAPDAYASTVNRIASRLSPRQKLQLVAFATLLRENTDTTSQKMVELLLQPWVERVISEFGWAEKQAEGEPEPS
jgi:transcriptional regulator with XRE-family HTH domain